MAITIGSNIPSLQTQRKLGESSESLSKAFEKLSSGLRINHASDDAAGLAVATSLNAASRIFKQAVRNVNDGISVLAIADSAIGTLSDINTRILELSEQSANGTYSNKQRAALDNEAQTLAKEYYRIARTTQFNGINLFDGSVQGMTLQAGVGNDAVLQTSMGGDIGTGNFETKVDVATGSGPVSVVTGDINGDGVADIISANMGVNTASILLGNGDGTFKAKTDINLGSGPRSVALSDLNSDGVLDLISGNAAGDNVSVLLGNGDGTFKAKSDYATSTGPRSVSVGDFNGDSVMDIVAGNFGSASVSILLGKGDGTFGSKTDFTVGTNPYSVAVGDFNRDGVADVMAANYGSSSASLLLGKGDGTFQAKSDVATGSGPISLSVGDLNGDNVLDLVAANYNANSLSVLLGNGNGTFTAKPTLTTDSSPRAVTLGDMNGDNILDIACANYGNTNASVFLGNGDGSFQTRTDWGTGNGPSSLALGDFNKDGVLDMVSANVTSNNISLLYAKTKDGISPLLSFSLKTQADSLQAMGPLNQNLERLAMQRGVIGALQSRLSTTTATLSTTTENYQAAESRIKDVDVAQESATLVSRQILQQVGTSVLAQANQQPQIALSLLRNV